MKDHEKTHRIHVRGNLIQTLQAASLIDEYNVWTFPVVLGRGKREKELSRRKKMADGRW